jgi:outer membrane protein W
MKSLYAGIIINKLNFGQITPSDAGVAGQFGVKFEFSNLLVWAENIDFTVDLAIKSFSNYTLHALEDKYTFINYNNIDYNLTTYVGYWRAVSVTSLRINIKTIGLCIPVSAVYRFSRGKNSPYVGLGVQNMFIIAQNKDFTYQRFYDEFNRSIPLYNTGLIIKAGNNFRLKNRQSIFTEFNFEYNQNLNINRGLKLINNMYSLVAGYNF